MHKKLTSAQAALSAATSGEAESMQVPTLLLACTEQTNIWHFLQCRVLSRLEEMVQDVCQ